MKVSEFIADRLEELGIRHVFGVGGANIEDMFAAVQRRRPRVCMVLDKHEHAAGTAADASARVTGGLGVVFVTSGGGAMNLVHSMAEARTSGVPLLAIVGEPPTELQGIGAFQDTSGRGGAIDAAATFGTVSVWCKRVERIEQIEQVPRLLSEALDAALGAQPGPAVLLLAKDVQCADLSVERPLPPYVPPDPAQPDLAAVRSAAALLRSGPVLIIAGDEVARANAQPDLASIAHTLDAQVAVAPEARDAFDNYSPRFVGISGAMGGASVERALARSAVCLLAGTRLPLLARQGLEQALSQKALVSLGRKRSFVKPSETLHVEAELRGALRALRLELGAPLPTTSSRHRPASPERPLQSVLDSRTALRVIEAALPDECVVIVDAGNTGATTVHDLRLPRDSRWLLAMGMAGMGYGFGAAIGAAFASGRRCFVIAGDGAFFMNGFDIHTAVEHRLPITYLIFNNSAHGMCLVREQLLLGGESGYNSFRRSHLGAGIGAMFPGIEACDCRTTTELADSLAGALRGSGPSVISIELDRVEIPPFASFRRLSAGRSTVGRGSSDEDH